jgi:glycerol 3-phosphatase-1
MITADDVTKGKPFPEPYLAGASRISKDIERCIVFEDAPSGIKSGVASGAKVLAVCTSHERKEVEGHGAHWIVDDLSK